MAEYKVLVMDGVAEEGLTPLRKEEDIEVVIGKKMSEEELAEVIKDYDAMIVRSATKVTRKIVENADKLKIVGRAGVGVDNIDQEACTERGILVVNAPGGNTMAATEHSIAMMLALARNIPQAAGALKNGVWDKKSNVGVELRGKVLGVIGCGRIGTAVARRAQAMEMDVVAYDPYINEEKAVSAGIKIVELDELLEQSDFITIHMPRNEETYHLINENTIAKMKEGVRIINCARGGIIDEKALYDGLVSNKISGAALDVFEKEPDTENPLHSLNNFIATPHLGASTKEAQLNVALDVADDIVAALKGDIVKNTVNVPSVRREEGKSLRPFLSLAEKLGKLQSQLVEGRINKVEVIYSGELASHDVSLVTTSLIKGMLDPVLQEKVNYVNAPLLAKNRGIQVSQTMNENANGYNNMITVRVTSDKTTKSAAGSLLRDKEPRIIMIDGYRIDTVPTGYMLYVPHIDKPRIIGPVGNLIGEHDINIATMQVGREEIGGNAVMMLTVDAKVPHDTLEKIKQLDGIRDVKFISL